MKAISFEELTKEIEANEARMANVARHKKRALEEIKGFEEQSKRLEAERDARYEKFPPYITTYQSIGGWKAILLTVMDDYDMYEPFNTGFGAYDTEAEAEVEAKSWAKDEGIEFRKAQR